jgi:hypothetical protein
MDGCGKNEFRGETLGDQDRIFLLRMKIEYDECG